MESTEEHIFTYSFDSIIEATLGEANALNKSLIYIVAFCSGIFTTGNEKFSVGNLRTDRKTHIILSVNAPPTGLLRYRQKNIYYSVG